MTFSVTEELNLVAVDRKVQFHDKYAFICCPYHKAGLEANPSMIVNLNDPRFDTGFFYCFSCGEKGPWERLASSLGLAAQSEESVQEDKPTLIQSLRLSSYELATPIPGISWRVEKDWRGISGKLLKDLDAKSIFNFKTKEEELYLPADILKKRAGGIYCSLYKKPKGYNSYRNEAGAWVKDALFPFNYAKGMLSKDSFLCVVEGPRDALNLIQHGLPAVAILGCNNWSTNILPLLYVCKPKKFVILMDGDFAGKKAAEKIYKDIDRYIPGKTILFNLPDGKDPGELTGEEILKLKDLLTRFV
jgi:hypothetical protein